MLPSRGLVLLLVGLLVLSPFTLATAVEAWTEGLYDAESDDIDQGVKPSEGAIQCTPFVLGGFVPVFVRLAPNGDDPAAPAAIQVARPSRAPPPPDGPLH